MDVTPLDAKESPELPEPPEVLDALEQRVLGCLLEKQMSTPEYYPLTLNALQAACNQSSNRDPVMQVESEPLVEVLARLGRKGLVWSVGGGRVLKYEHRCGERFGLALQEGAVLAELLLRGPQTPGELRTRCNRMYAFQDLEEVQAALGLLMEAQPPLVAALPRQPGTKETRYAQLLGGAPAETPASRPVAMPTGGLGEEVAALREELRQLRAEFHAFKAQFE